jgi:hypothetical protein
LIKNVFNYGNWQRQISCMSNLWDLLPKEIKDHIESFCCEYGKYINYKFWNINGLLHRDNDKPAEIYFNGKKTMVF